MKKIVVTESQLKKIIRETFITGYDDDDPMNINRQNPEKREADLSTLRLDKLNQGFNKIYLNDVNVGGFVIQTIGNVQDPHNHKIYKNSIFLQGGFLIDEEYRNMGIGRKVIKTIFHNNPNIENIFLYAIEWQGAVNFWKKIGGEDIFVNPDNGLHFIKIKKGA